MYNNQSLKLKIILIINLIKSSSMHMFIWWISSIFLIGQVDGRGCKVNSGHLNQIVAITRDNYEFCFMKINTLFISKCLIIVCIIEN